ncbi:hypothetical protein AWE51_15135 [Aquimarina aggregata]|uniref:LysM domain-containing protein n=1 Tax=Aquimarina aggregata TaxID=1642818 RepID=A0A162Y441_9FLAO|nr:LysM peptidoglycan-binding domain-containing protein [Aquimarina aggregata]KZS38913.1 hypothetical protein AWE51_15135 [Aquimarina aggregata]
MPIVSFKKYPHVTLTTPPLKILRPKINNAYFAEAKIENVEVTSTTKKKPEIYTVKSGDTLGKIATKKGVTIADIIKSDTQITEANKNDITIGQKITLPTNVASKETKQKITFTKTNTGTIGSDLYVIVETEDFQGYNVSINIKQGKEKGIEEQDKAIMLKDDQGAYNTKVITTVGGMCDTEYTNKDDFADMAIFKIVIDSSDDTKKKAWTDALEKAKDKKTPLYILADAHTLDGQEEMNINYFGDTEEGEIRGEKITNRWLDVDGSWFELEPKKCNCNNDLTLKDLSDVFQNASEDRKKAILLEFNKNYTTNEGNKKKLYEIFELDTCLKRAHFFAQTYVESLSNLSGAFNGESLNYSVSKLVSGYPFKCFKNNTILKQKAYEIGRGPYTYYKEVKKIDEKSKKEIIVKEKVKIPSNQKADQKAIANIAYADKNRGKGYKLGNTKEGDGWKFRGRGLLQITGKTNYTNSQKIINNKIPNSGIDLSKGSDKFTAKEAVFAGLADWYEKGCYKIASKGEKPENVDAITKKINQATKSYDDRKKAFLNTKKVFKLDECQTKKQ